jgi:hypothetical protein
MLSLTPQKDTEKIVGNIFSKIYSGFEFIEDELLLVVY